MSLPDVLKSLSLPVIASPMFIVSNPELVIAQCINGIVGSIPSLNARPAEEFSPMLTRIEVGIEAARKANPQAKIAPYAVNLIVHDSNDRLDHDLDICVQHKVPIIITSLRAPGKVVKAVHAYGGVVLHDVINIRHAQKALGEGVDGLIAVCAGAGGHAGTLNPFALIGEIRKFHKGLLAVSGAISRGADILAVQAMGADIAYIGTRFIATQEANAVDDYKNMIVESAATDIIYTPYFTGVNGNYLTKSVIASGLDPENLDQANTINFGSNRVKPWKNIWGAGQGVGNIHSVPTTATVITTLKAEYNEAVQRLNLLEQPYV